MIIQLYLRMIIKTAARAGGMQLRSEPVIARQVAHWRGNLHPPGPASSFWEKRRIRVRRRLLAVGLIQEGDDLGAGAGLADAELCGAHAAGDLALQGPENGLIVILLGIHVGEAAFRTRRLRAAGRLPEEGDHLLSGAGLAHAEGGGARAAGDLVLHGPHDRVVVVLFLDVREGIDLLVMLRLPRRRIEEGHDLLPFAGPLGGELSVAGAAGDPVPNRPKHRGIIIDPRLHIGKNLGGGACCVPTVDTAGTSLNGFWNSETKYMNPAV